MERLMYILKNIEGTWGFFRDNRLGTRGLINFGGIVDPMKMESVLP